MRTYEELLAELAAKDAELEAAKNLAAQLEAAESQVADLTATVADLNATVEVLSEEVKSLRAHQYGPRS